MGCDRVGHGIVIFVMDGLTVCGEVCGFVHISDSGARRAGQKAGEQYTFEGSSHERLPVKTQY